MRDGLRQPRGPPASRREPAGSRRRAWESCSEYARGRTLPAHARARCPRPARALRRGARPDRRSCSDAPDLTDAERSYDLLAEGFVLCNANRLDAAELRFERTADLGYLQDNHGSSPSPRGVWPSRPLGAATCPRRCAGSPPPRTRTPCSAPTTCSACRSCATSPRCSVRSASSREAAQLPRPGPSTVPGLHRPAAVGDVHARCPPGVLGDLRRRARADITQGVVAGEARRRLRDGRTGRPATTRQACSDEAERELAVARIRRLRITR